MHTEHPARKELDQLTKIVAAADKLRADAARWPAQLAQAEANQSAAEAAFLTALDARAAAVLSDAVQNVRTLSPVCAVLDRAGGPDGLRRKALLAPEVFVVFSAGFAKRLDALEKLKLAARALFARRSADAAVATGADLSTLVGLNMTPAMRDARTVLDRIETEAQAALTLRNQTAAPDKHEVPPFAGLFDALASLLPSVPAA